MMSSMTGPARRRPGLSVSRQPVGGAGQATRATCAACKATTAARSLASLVIAGVCGMVSTAARKLQQRLQRLQHPTSSQVLTVAVRGKPSTSHEEPTMAGRSGVLAANAFQGETAAMVFKTVAMAQMRLVARHLIKAMFQVPCNAMLSIPASHEEQTMARLSGVVAASAFQCEVAATVLQIAVMAQTRWIAPPLPPRQPLLPPPRQPPGMMARAPSK